MDRPTWLLQVPGGQLNLETVINRCTICWATKVGIVDALATRGVGPAAISRQTGLNRQALARHIRNGHVLAPPEMKPGQPDPMADAPTGTVYEVLKAELDAMLAASPSATQRLAIIAEQRRLADSRVRVEGPAPTDEVDWRTVKGLPDFLGALTITLDKHSRCLLDGGESDSREELTARMAQAGVLEAF